MAADEIDEIQADRSGFDLAAFAAKKAEIEAAAPGLATVYRTPRPSRWRLPIKLRMRSSTPWDRPDDLFFGYLPTVLPGELAWRRIRPTVYRVSDAIALSRPMMILRRAVWALRDCRG